MKRDFPVFRVQLLTVGTTFLLGLWGVLTIASSQSSAPEPLYLVGRQFGFLLAAMAVLLAAWRIPFDFYRRNWPVLAALCLLLLGLLPFLGVRINGMRGWFRLGEFQLQPSEPAKGIFLLALAVVLTRFRASRWRFGVAFLVASIWVAPILLQPDFGTGMIYLAAFAAIYFLAGGSWRTLGMLGGGSLLLAALFVWRNPYAWRRITGLFQPEADPLGSGWHIRQFELAIARGHYFGSKLGGAVWSNAYLPLSYNDSAFATMMETLGLFGTLPVLLFFGALAGSLCWLALRPGMREDARLCIGGAAVLIGIQSLVHISVNLCLLPPTGLTLPLVSYGGSSLVGTAFLVGLALSASREHGRFDRIVPLGIVEDRNA